MAVEMDDLLETCLIAGKIMIEGGSEMYRVEDTMNRIAYNSGVETSVTFTTPTGLFIGIKNTSYTQLRQVGVRSIDLEKVARVNTLSREYAAGTITLAQFHTKLLALEHHTPFFPVWWQLIAAGVTSATLMIIFAKNYYWQDFIPAAIIGLIGYAVFLAVGKLLNIRFLSEFLAAIVLGLLAILTVSLGFGKSTDNIIIGAVMPLVPGVAITNSVRDIIAGHLLSGIARGMEAIFTAAAIGTGIGLVIRFFG